MSQDYVGKACALKRKLVKASLDPTFHLSYCKVSFFGVHSRRLPSLHEHQVLKSPVCQPANDLCLAWLVPSKEDPEANLQASSHCESCSAQQCFHHPMLSSRNCVFLCILLWAKYTSGNPQKRGLLTVPTPTMLCGLIKDNGGSGGLKIC